MHTQHLLVIRGDLHAFTFTDITMNISFYFNDFVHSMIAIESNLLLYLIKRKHILNYVELGLVYSHTCMFVKQKSPVF